MRFHDGLALLGVAGAIVGGGLIFAGTNLRWIGVAVLVGGVALLAYAASYL